MRHRIVLVGFALLAHVASTSSASAQVVLEELPFGRVFSINNSGQAAGFSGGITRQATRWEADGTRVKLGTLNNDPDSSATGINDAGDVAGESWHAPFSRSDAALWLASGGSTNLGIPSGNNAASAVALNNNGSAAGIAYQTSTLVFRAFYWPATGGAVNIGSFGGDDSRAEDLNDSEVVVGFSRESVMNYDRPFRWEPGGSVVDLGVLPGHAQGSALAINESGDIVGYSRFDDSSLSIPVRWPGGGAIEEMDLVPTHPSAFYRVNGINDQGWSVGTATGSPSAALLWDPKGRVVGLEQLNPQGGTLQTSSAEDLNNEFQIVGHGVLQGVSNRPYRISLPAASHLNRHGSGVNPFDFHSASPPIINTDWQCTIDLTPTVGDTTTMTILILGTGQIPGALVCGTELLIQGPYQLQGGFGTHSVSLDLPPSVINQKLDFQGCRIEMDGSGAVCVLTNAIEIKIGVK